MMANNPAKFRQFTDNHGRVVSILPDDETDLICINVSRGHHGNRISVQDIIRQGEDIHNAILKATDILDKQYEAMNAEPKLPANPEDIERLRKKLTEFLKGSE